MRVLIYAHAFTPKVGGAENLVMLLAQGLAERLGWRNVESVTVTTPTPMGGFDDNVLPFRVVRRPSLLQLVRLIREANVVHLAGPCLIPMLLVLLLKKPTVLEHHGFQPICPNGLLFYGPNQMPCPGHFMAGRHYECLRCNEELGVLHSFKLWLSTFPRRWLCHRVSVNVAITEWLARELRLPNTAIIHCGIPDKDNGIITKTIRSPLTIAFIGRLVSTKGVHTLLHAAHRLKSRGLSFHLKIIGDGPERSNLEAQSNALNLTDCVNLMGYLPVPALQKALADVAVIVMPSLNGETFGLAAAENMMSGRLVIVSDIGVLSEVVGNAGLKFPPGNAEALATCLQKILENPELAEELRLKARKRALQMFRQERMIEDHLSLYGRVVRHGIRD
jgi:glycosyltransferase involved in cell wall biosynthesis